MRVASMVVVATIAGIAVGSLVSRTTACRKLAGRVCGRGDLVAVIGSDAFYAADVSPDAGAVEDERRRFIAAASIAAAAKQSSLRVNQTQVNETIRLLHSQAATEAVWTSFLRGSRLTAVRLHELAADWLCAREFIEARVDGAIRVTEDDCRKFYDTHRDLFVLPSRIRASHIFLAAPNATPPDVVAAKRRQIEEVAKVLARGADFAQVAATISEDEATKNRGGDLGWLSSARAPADFISATSRLQIGQISGVIQSSLGFHVVRIIATKPPRHLAFDEVRSEIASTLRNRQRKSLVADFSADSVAKYAAVER